MIEYFNNFEEGLRNRELSIFVGKGFEIWALYNAMMRARKADKIDLYPVVTNQKKPCEDAECSLVIDWLDDTFEIRSCEATRNLIADALNVTESRKIP